MKKNPPIQVQKGECTKQSESSHMSLRHSEFGLGFRRPEYEVQLLTKTKSLHSFTVSPSLRDVQAL